MHKSIRNLIESEGPVSVSGRLKLDIVPRTYLKLVLIKIIKSMQSQRGQ